VQSSDRHATRPKRPAQFHLRLECNQRYRQVSGILGDTAIIDTEYRMIAIEASDRCAARAGIALIARRPTRVAIVRTPRFLQDIAAERRHIAQLRAGRKL
jgi:hypothetical protein